MAPAIVALAGLTCEPAAGIQVDSAIILLDPGAHETGMKAASELQTYVWKPCRREMALHRGPLDTTPADANLALLVTVSLVLAMPLAPHAQQASAQNALAKRLRNSSEESLEVFEPGRNAGVLELRPVALPTTQYGDNNHLGWPVAVRAGNALVVLYRRIPGHNARLSGKADKDTSFAMVTRSTDGGRTWSAPFDLREVMIPELRAKTGDGWPMSPRSLFPTLRNWHQCEEIPGGRGAATPENNLIPPTYSGEDPKKTGDGHDDETTIDKRNQ